jgi:acyl carrier protein phosphodiesterase
MSGKFLILVSEVLYLTSGMNFLAHLYLSGDNAELKVGNFIGDFVKGKNLTERFPPDIAKGIALHREIDWFTDRHAVVKQSKDRLRKKYRHYSGVIVDVFYDHLLARNWGSYSTQLLPDFAEECYDTIQRHEKILPEEVKAMMPYMIRGNWLVNYAQVEGIQRALSGMTRRTRFESRMDESVVDLQHGYEDFKKEFDTFFPELIAAAQTWLNGQIDN